MSAGPQRTTYGPRKRHRRVRRPSLSLVDHLVSRLTACGMDPVEYRLRDPAAGGAAFLVPLARIKMAAWRSGGWMTRKSPAGCACIWSGARSRANSQPRNRRARPFTSSQPSLRKATAALASGPSTVCCDTNDTSQFASDIEMIRKAPILLLSTQAKESAMLNLRDFKLPWV